MKTELINNPAASSRVLKGNRKSQFRRKQRGIDPIPIRFAIGIIRLTVFNSPEALEN
jgi:hypothetical protein